jgi:hypothetical protein
VDKVADLVEPGGDGLQNLHGVVLDQLAGFAN